MTARGIRNNNPGNIRRVEADRWRGVADDQSGDAEFWVFKAPEWGIRALVRIVAFTYPNRFGLRTVRAIITRWAPPNENDTASYVRTVAAALGVDADVPLDFSDRRIVHALVCAIIRHENGINPYPMATIDQGIDLAQPPA